MTPLRGPFPVFFRLRIAFSDECGKIKPSYGGSDCR